VGGEEYPVYARREHFLSRTVAGWEVGTAPCVGGSVLLLPPGARTAARPMARLEREVSGPCVRIAPSWSSAVASYSVRTFATPEFEAGVVVYQVHTGRCVSWSGDWAKLVGSDLRCRDSSLMKLFVAPTQSACERDDFSLGRLVGLTPVLSNIFDHRAWTSRILIQRVLSLGVVEMRALNGSSFFAATCQHVVPPPPTTWYEEYPEVILAGLGAGMLSALLLVVFLC
jgi:hypothetical protein